ncbi:MAG: metalloregulator ArsR/SmtB family transcription factor [Planctomycetes bacterium]|nr:metalloregulator ArsR/SmtB family transcription factor [Planctomycetota bacterium]
MATSLPTLLKILADPTRLRLLGLLAREELAVGELARAVAMSQSRVSNHLKVLREARLLDERREGAHVLVQLARGAALPDDLWAAIESRLAAVEGRADDLTRLEAVLDERRKKSRAFFDRVAPEWDAVGSAFEHGSARWRALACLVAPGLVVADVGCGTGYMARALVRVVERVIAIDHSAAMLARAKENLAGHAAQVEFRQGELDRLPLADGEVDAIFASLVLHHVPDLFAALRDMRRALKPGGRLVVTDLLPHKEAWMGEAMADLKLGLDATELKSRAEKAGFVDVAVDRLDDAYVVEAPGGRRAALPLFLIHARVPQNAANDAARGLPASLRTNPDRP